MHTIITISRQYGSRGREIGLQLAEGFGIPFYDKKGLRQAALEMGIGEAMLETYGDKAGSLLYNLALSSYSFGYHNTRQKGTIAQSSALVAFEVIRKVAKKGPCVVVGRCADFVLRENPDLVSVFVHAPLERRIENVRLSGGLSHAQAEEKIRETDRMRRSYYNYYTDKEWGSVDSYNLSVDSGLLGIEATAGAIAGFILARERDSRERPQGFGDGQNVVNS